MKKRDVFNTKMKYFYTYIDFKIAIYDDEKNRNDENSMNFEKTRTHFFIDLLISILNEFVTLRKRRKRRKCFKNNTNKLYNLNTTIKENESLKFQNNKLN